MVVVYKEIMEELVAQLIAQNAESRGLDFKGQGSKAERAELIRDLMCFANTPDGGYILVGVEVSTPGEY